VLRATITRAAAVKARYVGADELERTGLREHLNYGHTLGHAIERVESFSIPHGHAVSIGLVFAAALSRRTRALDDDVAARHRQLLAGVGLPTTYSLAAWPALHDAMRHDKKARAGRLRFVVLDQLAQPSVIEAPEDAVLEEAFAEVVS
jgi:3-dehydroquinate synthase